MNRVRNVVGVMSIGFLAGLLLAGCALTSTGTASGGKQTAQVLPELLSEVKARGRGFVNLRDAFPAAVH